MNQDVLTPAEIKVIQTLIAGQSLSQAATAAGVSVSTVLGWRHDHALFERNLADALEANAILVQDALRSLVPKAVKALESILDDPAASPAIKHRAAQFILTNSLPKSALKPKSKPAASSILEAVAARFAPKTAREAA
jgi:hypothetical protein